MVVNERKYLYGGNDGLALICQVKWRLRLTANGMVTNEQAMTWKKGCFEYHQMYQYRTTTFGKSNRHR